MSSNVPLEGDATIKSTLIFQATLDEVIKDGIVPKRDQKICGVFKKIYRSYETGPLKESSSYHNCIQPFAKQDHGNMKKVLEGLNAILENFKETQSISIHQKGEINDFKKEVSDTLEKTYDQCKKDDKSIMEKPLEKDDDSTKSVLNYLHNKLKHKLLEGKIGELESLELALLEEEDSERATETP